jgi:ribonuclease HI
MAKQKFYTVWRGRKTGIFTSWDDCRSQVHGFDGALYKSFASREEAEEALRSRPSFQPRKKSAVGSQSQENIIKQSIAVDAACSGNPGLMEYRGVETATGREIFHAGPFPKSTNNIGEFLAIVHGLALLKQAGSVLPLYSDSYNAMLWVDKKQCRTKLEACKENAETFDLIARAEKWLRENDYSTRILKWNTREWGEIPADFGRK